MAEHYSAYLDGTLPEALHREVEAHLHACPQCAGELAELRALTDCLHTLPALPVPPRFAAGVRARIEAQPARTPLAWWHPVMTGGMAVTAALLILVVGRVGMTPMSRPAETRQQTKSVQPAENTGERTVAPRPAAGGATTSMPDPVASRPRVDDRTERPLDRMEKEPGTRSYAMRPAPADHIEVVPPRNETVHVAEHDAVAAVPAEHGRTGLALDGATPLTVQAETATPEAAPAPSRAMLATKAAVPADGHRQQLAFATLEARASADLRQMTLLIDSQAEGTLAVAYPAVYRTPEQSYALTAGSREIALPLAAQDDGALITLRLRSGGREERFYLIIPGDGAREPAVNIVLHEQAPREALVYLAHQAGVAVLCPAEFADAPIGYGTGKTPPLAALTRLARDGGYQVALANGVANITRRQ